MQRAVRALEEFVFWGILGCYFNAISNGVE